jgi:hypothetical protein
MKPNSAHCKMWCKDYPCKRTSCDRSILFENGITKLVEPKIYNYYRSKEKMRAYRESRNVKLNF